MFHLTFRSLLIVPTAFIRMSSCRMSIREKFRHQVLKQDRKYTLCRSQRGKDLCNHFLQSLIRRSTINLRTFRTSPKRDAWPLAAILVKLAGPFSKLSKLVAVIGGRWVHHCSLSKMNIECSFVPCALSLWDNFDVKSSCFYYYKQ